MNNTTKEYINVITSALTTEENKELRQKLNAYLECLWESNALDAEIPMKCCEEIIENIDIKLELDKMLADFVDKDKEERDKNIKEMRRLHSCNFCEEHELDDTLYDRYEWDNGISYDYVRVKYCPICGKKLLTFEEKYGKN